MFVHIDSRHRGFAHSHACRAVSGDQAAQELEQVRVVSDEKDVLAIGIPVDQLLKIGIARANVERRANFDFSLVAKFVTDKLRGLERTLQWTGDDDVWLDFEGAEKTTHQHALFLAFGNEAALGVKLCTITGNSGIGMPHQMKVHGGMGSIREGIAASFENRV